MIYVIFGPPGTGKTEFDLQFIGSSLSSGIRIDEVAYVTFMKSAARDGARRFGVSDEEYPNLWFRTLHSTAFKLLGLTRRQVVDPAWIRQFGKKIGLQIDPDDTDEDAEDVADAILATQYALVKKVLPGSVYRASFNLSRLLCRTPEELQAVRKEPHPKVFGRFYGSEFTVPAYTAFVEKYEREKAADGKLDFVDMLEQAVLRGVTNPRWKLAVIDEVQDMAPLQFRLIETLFFNTCETILMSGDDDQALMGFQGASASDFLSYRDQGRIVELRQTWRFGQDLVDFSGRISARISERHPKTIIGLSGKPSKILNAYDFDPSSVSGGELLLHRHVSGCKEIARKLVSAGVPFWNERGMNPLARSTEIGAYLAWGSLCERRSVRADDLFWIANHVPSVRQIEGEKIRLIKHGAKKKIQGLSPEREIHPVELGGYFTDEFLKSVYERDPRHLDIPFAPYYRQLSEKGYDLLKGRPSATITTIHGAKGRQASRVRLWSETFPKALREGGDDEHRVAYVGVTRAQEELHIVHDKLVGDWTESYSYPAGL